MSFGKFLVSPCAYFLPRLTFFFGCFSSMWEVSSSRLLLLGPPGAVLAFALAFGTAAPGGFTAAGARRRRVLRNSNPYGALFRDIRDAFTRVHACRKHIFQGKHFFSLTSSIKALEDLKTWVSVARKNQNLSRFEDYTPFRSSAPPPGGSSTSWAFLRVGLIEYIFFDMVFDKHPFFRVKAAGILGIEVGLEIS